MDRIDEIVNSRLEGYENYNSIYPIKADREVRGKIMRDIKERYPNLRVGCCEFFKLGYCIFTTVL